MIDLTRCRKMRRTWMALDTKANVAASYVGRCTSDKANAYWQHRAARWQHFADMQHAALKAEIGLTTTFPRTTSADTPPIHWRDVPTANYEAENEMESLTL